MKLVSEFKGYMENRISSKGYVFHGFVYQNSHVQYQNQNNEKIFHLNAS